MTNIARLDNKTQSDLRILGGHSAAFGDASNQMPILPTEFEAAQRHYPILFLRDPEGKLHSVIVLGFDPDSNLFLDAGSWDGYVPAIVRRGPFMIGPAGEDGDPQVLVDLDHPRVRQGGSEGMAVFLEQGEQSPLLEGAIHALRQLHHGTELATSMDALFTELDLVEPSKMQVQVDAEHAINFDGYLTVTMEKLAALDGKALAKLSQAHLLAPAIFAASSIHNMQRLILRKHMQSAAKISDNEG